MQLEAIQNALINLLTKANKSGAFDLEDANSAILALNGLAQLINQRNQVSTMDADNNPPIPTDPSKP